LSSPEPTTKEPFAPGALYEIKIDNDGDAVAEVTYSVQFAAHEDGNQIATVRRVQGERAAGVGDNGEVIVERTPVSVGREALVTQAGEYRFFFGWRSDPFFFDVNGNFNHMHFTGGDFFKDKNVCSIVIELPNSALGNNEMGIWARTLDKTEEGWIQADRGGRPMQAVFLVGGEREAYLGGEPADDDRFLRVFAHELAHAGGYAPQDATTVARRLLPDILSYNPREPTHFPQNGRTLTDDVVDIFLSTYTNGKVTGDNVGPHRDLLNEFPYVGPPHSTQVSFARDIKPLFRPVDISHMKSHGIKLDDYAFMSDPDNADKVLGTLSPHDGNPPSMPPGGRYWTEDKLALFAQWQNEGYQP
jgi:hypothetical protein